MITVKKTLFHCQFVYHKSRMDWPGTGPGPFELSGRPSTLYGRVGEPFCGRLPKPSINSVKICPRAHGNFEEKNKVLDSSIIIINDCIIITDALYN